MCSATHNDVGRALLYEIRFRSGYRLKRRPVKRIGGLTDLSSLVKSRRTVWDPSLFISIPISAALRNPYPLIHLLSP